MRMTFWILKKLHDRRIAPTLYKLRIFSRARYIVVGLKDEVGEDFMGLKAICFFENFQVDFPNLQIV